MHRPHGGETRFSRCRRLPFRGFAWAIVSVLASSWGCDATPTRTPPQRADIVIIVLDTVRWDRLSAYGYRRQTSPEFDRFASEGRLFRNAYASGGWTTPSHASLFTGFHPILLHLSRSAASVDSSDICFAGPFGSRSILISALSRSGESYSNDDVARVSAE